MRGVQVLNVINGELYWSEGYPIIGTDNLIVNLVNYVFLCYMQFLIRSSI